MNLRVSERQHIVLQKLKQQTLETDAWKGSIQWNRRGQEAATSPTQVATSHVSSHNNFPRIHVRFSDHLTIVNSALSTNSFTVTTLRIGCIAFCSWWLSSFKNPPWHLLLSPCTWRQSFLVFSLYNHVLSFYRWKTRYSVSPPCNRCFHYVHPGPASRLLSVFHFRWLHLRLEVFTHGGSAGSWKEHWTCFPTTSI